MKGISYILFFISLNLFSLGSFSQNAAYKKADKLYDNFQYAKAIKIYKTLLDDNPKDIYLIQRLAYSNFKIGDYPDALHYYSALVASPSASPNDWFQYAQLLKIDGNYTDAQKWFEKYLTEDPNNELVKNKIEILSELDQLIGSRKFTVRRTNKNSRFTDMCPAIYNGSLVFSSARDTFSVFGNDYFGDGQPYLDLYIAGFHRMVLYEVRKFAKELNTPLHEGPVAFSSDGKKIFITRNSLIKGKKNNSSKGVTNLKIYISEWDGKKWGKETEFQFNSNKYSVGHPAITKDGKTIYFVSDMPGGYGKTDIYKSQLTAQGWSQPENLGPTINTSEKEMFPTLDSAGNIYFSSNGHPGFGGLDIFIAVSDESENYLVQNLGNTLNSTYDDFSLIFDDSGKSGYFTSNRLYGEGEDDIYYFEVE
ncbi:tetratricopeptide repeat protein [Sunxiuqinia sp. A32]|uniref:tetratricopeptide repeat protein n=1 Tax=Sunxiuqinia sp. A32 TaxID=3461496 RepID=UPI0040465C39